jgi:hypothetical protein
MQGELRFVILLSTQRTSVTALNGLTKSGCLT